jgi:multiple sugar transport system ATP-binding protein
LSGGERQRVALSRAIAKRPRVFLLDEPLSNLDAVLRERMRLELKTLFKKLKATVIYVTHDQVEAMSLSDKVALIEKGRIRQFGTAEELYERPADLFVASFIGSPRINILHGKLDDNRFISGSGRWPIPDRYLDLVKDRKEVILGVRPEDIRIDKERRETSFRVRRIMSEKLGNTVVLNLRWQEEVLRVSSTKNDSHETDDELWIQFDKDKLLLFDPLTKRRLNPKIA